MDAPLRTNLWKWLCHPGERDLLMVAENEADDERRAAVARHLSHCRRCRTRFQHMLDLRDTLRSAPGPRDDVLERIMERRSLVGTAGVQVVALVDTDAAPIPPKRFEVPPVVRIAAAVTLAFLLGSASGEVAWHPASTRPEGQLTTLRADSMNRLRDRVTGGRPSLTGASTGIMRLMPGTEAGGPTSLLIDSQRIEAFGAKRDSGVVRLNPPAYFASLELIMTRDSSHTDGALGWTATLGDGPSARCVPTPACGLGTFTVASVNGYDTPAHAVVMNSSGERPAAPVVVFVDSGGRPLGCTEPGLSSYLTGMAWLQSTFAPGW